MHSQSILFKQTIVFFLNLFGRLEFSIFTTDSFTSLSNIIFIIEHKFKVIKNEACYVCMYLNPNEMGNLLVKLVA